MSNQAKNPVFWSVVAFFLGIVIGALGLIKNDATNYVGAGFLKGLGVTLIVLGGLGMFTFGNRKG